MADVVGASCRRMRRRKSNSEPGVVQFLNKVGDHLTRQEVNLLTILSGRNIDERLKGRIKNGRDFLSALVQSGTCDESEFTSIYELLRRIKRSDLIHMICVRGENTVYSDNLDKHFAKQKFLVSRQHQDPCVFPFIIKSEVVSPSMSDASTSTDWDPPRKKTRNGLKRECSSNCWMKEWKRTEYTCNVTLKVSAEYHNQERVLQVIEPSENSDPPERKAACFNMALNILENRNLGSITCDITFSEVTYLDAFWRDYLNGSLLESLKSAFITESMKQTMEQHHIVLLVYVDEADYIRGRSLLLKNLD